MLPYTLFLIASAFASAQASNITCAASDLAWYTSSVGETPCKTYERLRQLCNSEYTVGTFKTTAPGDTCNDQVGDCCCNSIAFALSMLCMNCQQDVNSQNGIDAPFGTYQTYLATATNNCPISNQSLPADIQTATCRAGIKIYDSLYSLFWPRGDWYYTYTRETLETAFSANGQGVFGRCASFDASSSSLSTAAQSTPSLATSYTSIPSSSSSSSSASLSTSSSSSKKLLTAGAITGIVLGTLAAVLAVCIVLLLIYWRRVDREREEQRVKTEESPIPVMLGTPLPPMSMVDATMGDSSVRSPLSSDLAGVRFDPVSDDGYSQDYAGYEYNRGSYGYGEKAGYH